MAAQILAIKTLVQTLKKTGKVCKTSFAAAQSAPWSEADFSFALYSHRKNPHYSLCNLLCQKLEQHSEVTSFASFPNLLRFATVNSNKISKQVFTDWGLELAKSGQLKLVNSLVARIGVQPIVFQELDKKLAQGCNTETTTVLSDLIWNLIRSRYMYSSAAYENILAASARLWFPSRELSHVLFYLQFTSLSSSQISKYLEHFSGQVESKTLSMTPVESSKILVAYTTSWTKASEKIVGIVMRGADLDSIGDEHMTVVLRALAQHPTFDDDFLFSELEPRVLTMALASSIQLTNLIVAYSKRQYPSPDLYEKLKTNALKEREGCIHDFLYLMKHPCCTREDRETLEELVKKRSTDQDVLERSISRLTSIGETSVAQELLSLRNPQS